MGNWVLGIDLAEQRDWTALVFIETDTTATEPTYAIRRIERWRGVEYPDTVTRIAAAVKRLQAVMWTDCTLVVDATGVGLAVTELLRRALPDQSLVAITITAGLSVTEASPGDWRVGKAVLVSTVDALLATNRLQVGRRVAHQDTLVRELHNFRRKYTAAANETFAAARETEHDDLVMATAIACWAVEHGPARPVGVWSLQGPSGGDPATRPIGWYSDEYERPFGREW